MFKKNKALKIGIAVLVIGIITAAFTFGFDTVKEETEPDLGRFSEKTKDEVFAATSHVIKGTFVKEEETTAENMYAQQITGDDGDVSYVEYIYKYTLENGDKVELVKDYVDEEKPQNTYYRVFKSEDGLIYITVHDLGVDPETKECQYRVLEKSVYDEYLEYERERASQLADDNSDVINNSEMQENTDPVAPGAIENSEDVNPSEGAEDSTSAEKSGDPIAEQEEGSAEEFIDKPAEE